MRSKIFLVYILERELHKPLIFLVYVLERELDKPRVQSFGVVPVGEPFAFVRIIQDTLPV